MASNTKGDIQKLLAQRNIKVQYDDLKFRMQEKEQKIEKMKVEMNNLRIENEMLKAELKKLRLEH